MRHIKKKLLINLTIAAVLSNPSLLPPLLRTLQGKDPILLRTGSLPLRVLEEEEGFVEEESFPPSDRRTEERREEEREQKKKKRIIVFLALALALVLALCQFCKGII